MTTGGDGAFTPDGTTIYLPTDGSSMDSGALADAMQSVRRSLKMADRLAGSYIPPMGGERYLTDRDMAERLHVSRRTLQQYRHEGILPYFLFGGKTLYRESDVQKVLERNYRKAY